MKRMFTFGGQMVERNVTVADIQKAKGTRKLVQVNPVNAEEARAADEAGADMFICPMPHYEAVRAAAPTIFTTVGVNYTQYVTADDTLRGAMKAVEMGGDAVYCNRSMDVVRHLTREAIPVMGHLGLVPRKSTWIGGLRAYGKTAAEAMILYDEVRRLEDAGAFAVEMEVVAAEAMALINARTSLVTISLGSGAGCDVDYLFIEDICGLNPRPPRHAMAYADLKPMRQAYHEAQVAAIKGFADDVADGTFDHASHAVKMPADELDKFREALEKSE